MRSAAPPSAHLNRRGTMLETWRARGDNTRSSCHSDLTPVDDLPLMGSPCLSKSLNVWGFPNYPNGSAAQGETGPGQLGLTRRDDGHRGRQPVVGGDFRGRRHFSAIGAAAATHAAD